MTTAFNLCATRCWIYVCSSEIDESYKNTNNDRVVMLQITRYDTTIVCIAQCSAKKQKHDAKVHPGVLTDCLVIGLARNVLQTRWDLSPGLRLRLKLTRTFGRQNYWRSTVDKLPALSLKKKKNIKIIKFLKLFTKLQPNTIVQSRLNPRISKSTHLTRENYVFHTVFNIT